ncbi:unnamed protein product [Clonostachys chloroleuca]|uniref:Uncharacterized protein n=1 Tax=Clonostachys chloroleuca TaxID=1926264 RepID=A0AA35M8H6_9HYPO|nr:unnamed protein product [Clonostachys chloroleuca]
MDWQNPMDTKRVVLGVIKLAAKTEDNPVPPLFINPGGPGGSGIEAVLRTGQAIQMVAGDNHDIISWDPRGVGVSTPRVDCWKNNQKRLIWNVQDAGVVDERPGLVYDAYAHSMAFSGACESGANETSIFEHLSTVYHARDMLEIMNRSGHEKLRYWGMSYGSILGGVFASMYPDQIERMGDSSQFFQDADSILLAFDKACHGAGAEVCSLWAESPEAVGERRDAILAKLKKSPVIIPAGVRESGPEMPQVITYSILQVITRTILYSPLKRAQLLAQLYSTIESGDSAAFYDASVGYRRKLVGQACAIADIPATEPQETSMEMDAFPAITCSDAKPEEDSPEQFVEFLEKLHRVSKWAGASNMYFKMSCVGRTIRPKWHFAPDENTRTKTSHPILFVNNVYDSITPLESAYNNSAHFPGSVVLTQNAYGHCSSSAPSSCTTRYLRAYFQNGTLPEPGTVCEPEYHFFESPGAMAQDELSDAAWEMFEKADVVRMGNDMGMIYGV